MSKGREWALGRLRSGVKRLVKGAENARKIMQKQRELPPYAAPFELVLTEGILKLRHYPPLPSSPSSPPTEAPDTTDPSGAPEAQGSSDASAQPVAPVTGPLLFVPPLMVTAEVYDISPELSAIVWLQRQGVDVWLADFGRPEEEDGWDRTLDDHVIAVDRAIDEIAARTGKPVHVAGYSQGGMFTYQAAAYRKGADVASLITFGSPVDLRRNMPIKIHDALAERFLSVAQSLLKIPINEIKGLPGMLNSYGFKLLSPAQEVKYIWKVMGMLDDEEALQRILPTRRFLGGEGFIAWPGPALRKFVDEYIVNNRLLSGGFVINGKSASLADIDAPIFCFIGEKDEFARPPAIRAIHKVVLHDEIYERSVQAGHFGLVVGSRAMAEVWPQVAAWLAWRDDLGPRPRFSNDPPDESASPPQPTDEGAAPLTQPGPDDESEIANQSRHMGTAVSSWKPLKELAVGLAGGAWQQLGQASLSATDALQQLRWQLPRMARLMSLDDGARTSIGRLLARQARAIPDVDFFFWRGQVHTYAEADRWVDQLAFQLHQQGIESRQRVAVAMEHHPGYLLTVAALSRLGAVAVLLPPRPEGDELTALLVPCAPTAILVDGHHLPRLQASLATAAEEDAPTLLLFDPMATQSDELPPAEPAPHILTLAMTRGAAANEEIPIWPEGFVPDPGMAGDLAMIVFTAGTTGPPKAVQISNRRWATAALATAATCTLRPKDTVYCSIPLHHSAGILLNVGGALISGARIALVPSFSPQRFWRDVRRLGVTVAFYLGPQARALLAAPPPDDHPDDRHSLRLLAGSGMDDITWKGLLERYEGLKIIEYYGTAEGNVILVNAQGSPQGAVGQPLFGKEREDDLVLVQADDATGALVRDESGRCLKSPPDQPGVLLSRVDQVNTPFHFAPYVDPVLTEQSMIRGAFADGDAWFVSNDWMQRDPQGNYFFLRPLRQDT